MMVGGALVALGIVVGTWIAGPSAGTPALAAPAQDRSQALAAITMERTQMVLLRDNSGLYFFVDAAGNVAPLRVPDVELRDLPGKSLLRAP
jgi:hypothetical protein